MYLSQEQNQDRMFGQTTGIGPAEIHGLLQIEKMFLYTRVFCHGLNHKENLSKYQLIEITQSIFLNRTSKVSPCIWSIFLNNFKIIIKESIIIELSFLKLKSISCLIIYGMSLECGVGFWETEINK